MSLAATNHPMNAPDEDSGPITWPITSPSSLGEDAKLLYKLANTETPSLTIHRDWFDGTSPNRYVRSQDAKSYVPSERDLSAIAEIVNARLGTYNPERRRLHVERLHENYTVAYGRGSQLIQVYVSESAHFSHEGQLLATLVGADLESRRNNTSLASIEILARHETATDSEHDASATAALSILAPSIQFIGYGSLDIHGFLDEAKLYPIGTDPTQLDDDGIAAGEMCDSKHCSTPHPFAPYRPDEISIGRKRLFVQATAYPLRPYLVQQAQPKSL